MKTEWFKMIRNCTLSIAAIFIAMYVQTPSVYAVDTNVQTTTARVTNTNRAPYFFDTANSYDVIARSVNFTFSAKAKDDDIDIGNNVDIAVVSVLPSWITVNNPSPSNPVTLTFTANPQDAHVGAHTIQIKATDSLSLDSATFTITLTVNPYACSGAVKMYDAGNGLVDCFTQIQPAFDDSRLNNGYKITADAGTYGKITLNKNKSITIEGLSGESQTIIDANNSGSAVTFEPAAANITLRGFKIQNGHSTTHGGGILIKEGATNITIENNNVTNNKADGKGGGIAIIHATTSGSININQTNVLNNSAANNPQSNSIYADGGNPGSGDINFNGSIVAGQHGGGGGKGKEEFN